MQTSRYYRVREIHGVETPFFSFSLSLSLSLPFFFALLPVLFTCLFCSPPPSSLSLSLSLFLRFAFTRFVLMTKIARETRGAYYLTGRLKK